MNCIKEENKHYGPWNDFSAGRTNSMADNVTVSLHSDILTHNKSYAIFLTETEYKNEGPNECIRYVSANSPLPSFWEQIYW